MRYNFHEQHASVKKNPKYVLPDDINAPVIKFLESSGCEIGVEILKEFERRARYGKIELVHDSVPNAKLVIQVDCGMADGYTVNETGRKGKWSSLVSYTIKNSNIDKSKKGVKKNG